MWCDIALKLSGGHVEYIHLAPVYWSSAQTLYKKIRIEGSKWIPPPQA